MALITKDLRKLFLKGQQDPVFFTENVVAQTKLWAKQKEIMYSVRDNYRTTVRSCNGAGKCQFMEDAIILGDGSVVKAKDLVGRHFDILSYDVVTGKQVVKPAYAMDNGIKPCYEITTKRGNTYIRTYEHPLRAAYLTRHRGIKPEMPQWVEVQDLVAGMGIVSPTQLDIDLPDYIISDDDIKLMAYLLADGGTTCSITFTNVSPAVLSEMRGIVEAKGCVLTPMKHDRITYGVSGCNGKILNLVRSWGMHGVKAKDKRLPPVVWRFSKRQLRLFINRFLACDGWAYDRKGERGSNQLGTTLASEGLIDDLKYLFLRIGFAPCKTYKPVKLNGTTFDSWTLLLSKQADIVRFANEVNIFSKEDAVSLTASKCVDENKTHKWNTMGLCVGYDYDVIVSVKPVGNFPTVAISVEDTHTYVTTAVEHNTFTSASVVAWFLTSHPQSIVISTAPTSRQVRELLWQEINNIARNSKYPLGGDPTLVQWTLGPKWFALGLSTDDANRFQGFHAEHILGVIDEAAGVDAPIWEAMDAILTSHGARLLTIGNPTEPSGRFYDSFFSPLYNKIHISAFDTPNFTEKRIVYPALITPKWVEERKMEWGEDSPAYQARVLGEFPLMGDDTMIPLGWVLRAKERPTTYEASANCYMAIDVARFGDDDSVIAVRRGNSLVREDIYHAVDVHKLSKLAKLTADEEKPLWIKVDAVGIGAGVADNLRAWGYPAMDYVAQGRAWLPEKFINKRTESWYTVRERFRKDEINLPGDELLVGQLTSPKYDFDASGRYRLEAKEKMKLRGLSSPDRADAIVMLFEGEEAYESIVHPDFPKGEEFAAGTVGALLKSLEQGESEELKWATLRF